MGLLVFAGSVAAGGGGSIALEPRTSSAYDGYLRQAQAAFLARAGGELSLGTPMSADLPAGEGTPGGRIVKVPGGLVHHWRGRLHIPAVDLTRVLSVARNYSSYPEIHPRVIEARLVAHDDDRFMIVTRIKESAATVSAVLELRSVVSYRRFPTSAYSISATEEVREVLKPGLPDEHLLPPGRGSGYLWRANTFTRFVERDGGVDVELETIGLSRRFPPLLGWLIEPIAKRLGRSSVERTLLEFARAVRRVPALPAPTP